jgi:hypothetical protein
MFAKDLSNPPAADHQDAKARSFIVLNIFSLCLGAFVAIFPVYPG